MRKCFILLLAAGGVAAWAQTNLTTPKAAPVLTTEITSDSAVFNDKPREMVYLGHVFVTDPKINLHCERLTVDMPQEGRPTNAVAETNVVIDFIDNKGMNNHVTAARVVYMYGVRSVVSLGGLTNNFTNEVVTFYGPPKPMVTNLDFTLESEPLIWDRAKGSFRFEGGYKMTRNHHLEGGTNNSPINFLK